MFLRREEGWEDGGTKSWRASVRSPRLECAVEIGLEHLCLLSIELEGCLDYINLLQMEKAGLEFYLPAASRSPSRLPRINGENRRLRHNSLVNNDHEM